MRDLHEIPFPFPSGAQRGTTTASLAVGGAPGTRGESGGGGRGRGGGDEGVDAGTGDGGGGGAHEFDENGDAYVDDSCLGDGMQPPVLYSAEIMSSVTDRSVGVQCDTAELKTAGAQTDENEDAGDSSEIMRFVASRLVSVQCDTAELKTAGAQTDENDDDLTAPRRLSIGIPGDQPAGGALTPTTDTTVAERRVSDEAGTDPPESDASGSEKEIRLGPTALTQDVDSSREAQSHCSAVGHETGYDEEVTAITDQVGSAFESEQEAGCGGDEDAPPKGIYGLPETTHTDVAASGSEAETSDGDSECDEPYSPDLDIVFDVRRAGRGRWSRLGASSPDSGGDFLESGASGRSPG